jgi:hypothetical protein
MEMTEPLIAAAKVIEERFPDCRDAFLSRSVLGTRRTPTSDLDIVVILDGPPAPFRETIRAHGWIVEVFVHSRDSLQIFYERDAQARRCTLAGMCVDGHVLRSLGNEASEIQDEARAFVEAGPAVLSEDERELRRYRLTDILDDLRGTSDPVEVVFIAAQLLQEAGELALINERRWSGQGKWLARNLEESPDDIASQLADAFKSLLLLSEKQPMIEAVSAILDRAGGPLSEGFVRRTLR